MLERPKLVIYSSDVQAHRFIHNRFPEVATHIEDTEEGLSQAIIDADIVFMARKYRRETVLAAQSLRWLHLAGAGVDRLRPYGDFASHITITHTPTLNAQMIADYVLCVISMLTWDFPRLLQNQHQNRWQRWMVERLEAKTLLMVGLGNIGSAISQRARAAGMSILGIRRQPQPQAGFIDVVGPEQLLTELPRADYVVVCAPLTSKTEGMIGARELRAMKKSAYLVNVARGAIVDETALIAALEQKQIAGAALDVFSEEPLPADNRLWQLANVIVTPHISSWSDDYNARASELFCANLERYLAQQPLQHVIDRSQEY